MGELSTSGRSQELSQEFDDDEIKQILEDPNSSRWMKFRAHCARLSGSQGFELLNACIIMVNAIVLGLNWCAILRFCIHICCQMQTQARPQRRDWAVPIWENLLKYQAALTITVKREYLKECAANPHNYVVMAIAVSSRAHD
eukprot:scaffold44264_cov14-Tisochrysis_lutea.AAC.1